MALVARVTGVRPGHTLAGSALSRGSRHAHGATRGRTLRSPPDAERWDAGSDDQRWPRDDPVPSLARLSTSLGRRGGPKRRLLLACAFGGRAATADRAPRR